MQDNGCDLLRSLERFYSNNVNGPSGTGAAVSEQDNCDSLIPPPQVRIALQLRIPLDQPPNHLIAPRPVFSEDKAPNLIRFLLFLQAPLYRDPNVPARAS